MNKKYLNTSILKTSIETKNNAKNKKRITATENSKL